MRVFVDAQGLLDDDPHAAAPANRRARDRRRMVIRLAQADPGREWWALIPHGAETRGGVAELTSALRPKSAPAEAFDPAAPGGALGRALALAGFIDAVVDRRDFYWSLAPLDPAHVFPCAVAVPRVVVTLDDCGVWARPQRLAVDLPLDIAAAHRARLRMALAAADALVFSSRAAEAEGRLAFAPGLHGVETAVFWGDLDPAFTPPPATGDPTGAPPYALLNAEGLEAERFQALRQRVLDALVKLGGPALAVIAPDGGIIHPGSAKTAAPTSAPPEAERAILVRRAELVVIGSEAPAASGRTALEALACGRPSLIPDRPAAREAAGGAGVIYEPESADSLLAALERARCETGPDLLAGRLAAAAAAQAEDPAGVYRRLFHEAGRRPARFLRPRPKLAILGPWPPQASPAAVYSWRLAQALRERADITVFVEGEPVEALAPLEGVALEPIEAFAGARDFDRVFAHLANSPAHHARCLAIAYETPGVDLILHEAKLHPLARALYTRGIAPAVYLHALEHQYSKHFIERHIRDEFAALPLSQGAMLGRLAYAARRIILHDAAGAQEIAAERAGEPGATAPEPAAPMLVWPHPLEPWPEPPAPTRADPGDFVIGLFLSEPEGLGSPRAALALAALRALTRRGVTARLRIFRAKHVEPAAGLRESDLSGVLVELAEARFDMRASPDLMERARGCDLWLSLPAPDWFCVDPGLILGLEAGLPCVAAGAATALASARGLAAVTPLDATPQPGRAALLAETLGVLLLSPARRAALVRDASRAMAAHHGWRSFAEAALFEV